MGSFDPSADVHVFSKHWDYGEQLLARESPCPIFDLCDDWFGRKHDLHYREMCNICEVVVSSRRLGEIVYGETGRGATYIPEPYELPEGRVKEPRENPDILWFGHSANLETVKPYLDLPRLFICSNVKSAGVIPYTLDNLRKCLAACDVVIIPQDRDWKSANRMVESLRAGRFCIASDIPAYRGFSQYLGDIKEGLAWLSRNGGTITERIISGRSELSSFSPERVGQMWFDCISAAVQKSSVGTSI